MDLVRAVAHAHAVLSWQENLARDEMPPEWMWHLDDELEFWFEEVDRQRRERFNLPEDDDRSGNGKGGWVRNEMAKGAR